MNYLCCFLSAVRLPSMIKFYIHHPTKLKTEMVYDSLNRTCVLHILKETFFTRAVFTSILLMCKSISQLCQRRKIYLMHIYEDLLKSPSASECVIRKLTSAEVISEAA